MATNSTDQQAQNELASMDDASNSTAAPPPATGTTGPSYSNVTTTGGATGTTSGDTGYTPPGVASSPYEYEEYGQNIQVVLGSIGPELGLPANTPVSVSSVLEAFSKAPQRVILSVERQMNSAGLYSSAGVGAAQGQAVEEGTVDQNSLQTLISGLVQASNNGADKAGSGTTFTSFLQQQTTSGAGANENEVIPSAEVSTGSADDLQLTNPDDLYQTLYQTFQSELGRAPSDSELKAFVKQYQGEQTKAQMGQFNAQESTRFQNYQGQVSSRDAQTNAETAPRVANGAVSTNINSPATYANALLSYLNVPETSNNTQAIVAWINAQGSWGNGSFNPLGSQQGVPGSTTQVSGPQTYQNFQESIQAMGAELQNYPYIMAALTNGNLSSSMTSNAGTKAEINKITNGNGTAVDQNLNAAAHVAKQNKQTKLKNASHANKQQTAGQASQAANYQNMSLMQKVAVVQNAATAHGKSFSQQEESDVVSAIQNGANVQSLVQQVQNGRLGPLNTNPDATEPGGAAVSPMVSAVQNFIKGKGLKAKGGAGAVGSGAQQGGSGVEGMIPRNAGGTGQNPSQNNASTGLAAVGSAFGPGSNNINNPTQWAQAILAQIGAPETSSNVNFLTSWAAQEGGNWNNTAKYNPLNTTQQEQGSSVMGGGNSAGVQAYNSWSQGNDATVKTLEGYQSIMSALMSGDASKEDQSGKLSADFQKWSGGSYSSINIDSGGKGSATATLGQAAGTGMATANATAQSNQEVPAQDTSPQQNPSAPGDMFIPDTVTTDVQAPTAADAAFTDATTGANAVPYLGNQFLSSFGAIADMIKGDGITASGAS